MIYLVCLSIELYNNSTDKFKKTDTYKKEVERLNNSTSDLDKRYNNNKEEITKILEKNSKEEFLNLKEIDVLVDNYARELFKLSVEYENIKEQYNQSNNQLRDLEKKEDDLRQEIKSSKNHLASLEKAYKDFLDYSSEIAQTISLLEKADAPDASEKSEDHSSET